MSVDFKKFSGSGMTSDSSRLKLISELKKQTKDAVVIAIHQGDPMQFSLEATLRSHFGVTGFPTAFIDRKARWTPPEPANLAEVTGKLTKKAWNLYSLTVIMY